MNKPMNLVTGLAVGAAAMYILDPNKGRRRRATLRDQVGHLTRQTGSAVNVSTRDLAHRVQGMVAVSRNALRPQRLHPSDEILEDRVRAKLGRYVSHPHAIDVHAHEGHITLDGLILTHEIDPLISAVFKIPGVNRIENRLEAHQKDDHLPSLQGGLPRTGEKINLFQSYWSPSTRLVVGLLAMASLVYGSRRREAIGNLMTWTGLFALTRSITHAHFQSAIMIHKTVNIHAPIDEVFLLFTHRDHFPGFIKNITIVEKTKNRTLHWKQTEGSLLNICGQARFFESDPGKTKIEIDFSYQPPLGELGHLLARTFGIDLKKKLEASLLQIKQILEQGEQEMKIKRAV